jgi:hypothetical protein
MKNQNLIAGLLDCWIAELSARPACCQSTHPFIHSSINPL